MTSRQRRLLPVAVAVGIVALVVVVVIIVTSMSGGAAAGDYGLNEAAQDGAPQVSQLAADAAQAADDVDIEAGLALMCQAPSAEQVDTLKAAIAAANEKAGGEAGKSLTITDAQQAADTGTFGVQIQGEGALAEYAFSAVVEVQKSGDSWCIAEIHIND